MTRHLMFLGLTYAALVFDASSQAWNLPTGTAPQFLLMTAALALLLCDGTGAIFWAAATGLLIDSSTRGPLGLNVVLLANLTFFGQLFGLRGLRDSIFASGAVIWVYVTVAASISLMLRSVLFAEPGDVALLAQIAAGRAGGSVAVFLLVMLTSRTIRRALRLVLPSANVGGELRGWAG